MDKELLQELLQKVKDGQTTVSEALDVLKGLPFEDLKFAKVDHHRCLRNGFPEVIFGQGKNPGQVAGIVKALLTNNNNILATRCGPEVFMAVREICPDAEYHELAQCITVRRLTQTRYQSPLLVVSAGTADLPVAEEAAISAEIMGNTVQRVYDVGVAGIHRLFHHRDTLLGAAVIIVVAGMEGALASVVGGLVDKPVLAVPTSIGYGASFGGLAALLTMLNSCAAGIGVLNIDNGYGAAALATSIIRLKETPVNSCPD